MNLGKWDLDFDDQILARGRRYYEEGRVLELVRDEDTDTWTADVEGSEVYHVSVTLTGDETEPLVYSCTCPYSGAPYCKHTAAVMYAMEEDADRTAHDETDFLSAEKLCTLPKEQLAELLIELCEAYPDAGDWIKARLAPKDEVVSHYRNLIHASAYACMHRGFISYRDMNRALTGAETALLYLQDHLSQTDDLLLAVDFAHMVLVETMAILNCGDDSDGGVGYIIEQTLEEIRHLYELQIADAPSAEQRTFFERILSIAGSDLFRGWDHWNAELLDICIEIADEQPDLRSRVLQLHEEDMRRCEQDRSSYSSSYRLESAQKATYELLCRWKDAQSAQQFLISHPENEGFRQILIQQYRDAGRFQEAIDLCTSAEKAAREARYPGTERQWKALRYDILSQMGNRSTMIALGQELLLDGDGAYYQKLKALIPKEEWAQRRVQLLDQAESSNRSLYESLILHDRDTARIIRYVRAHPSWIYEAYQPLVSEYPDDVRNIFIRQILDEAVRASTRPMYQDICRHIALLHQVSGAQAAESLIAQLRLKYRRKPAFLDELGKISSEGE